MIKREAVTNNIVDDLNSRNENWDKLETMSNQLETEYEPRLTNAETNIVDLQQGETEYVPRLTTAETNINGLLPKVDLATIDTQTGTSVQSKIADDCTIDLIIEGATTVAPTNPLLDISPDNVATITSAKNFDVVACGKNLFDGRYKQDTLISGTSGDFLTTTGCRTTEKILVNPNTYYTIKSDDRVVVRFESINGTFIGADDGKTSHSYTFKTPLNCMYVYIYYSRYGTNVSNIQLELGSTATTYVPYQGLNKLTITKELNKLPNGVADTRERIDDKYVKYTHRIGKTTRTTTGSIVDAKTNGQYICSVAPSGFLNGTTFTMPSGTTSAEILYELATPIETIVEEPSTLTSYKGVTNVFTTATVQPKLTANFKSRLKNTTEILLSKIEQLTNAIVQLGGTV